MSGLHDALRGMMPGVGYRTRERDLIGGGEGWARSPGGLYVPVEAQPRPLPTCIDLFAGAGGFSLGMHQGGFHVAAAADGDHVSALTYLTNLGDPDTVVHVLPGFEGLSKADQAWHEEHAGAQMTAAEFFELKGWHDARPGSGWIASRLDHEPGSCAAHIEDEAGRLEFCDAYHASPAHTAPCLHYFLGDARQLTGAAVLEALGVERGEVGCVVGGPPCQGFSSAGKRNVMDPRNSLVFEFGRICIEILPKSLVMENVPGILSMVTPEGLPVMDTLCRILEEGGMGTFDALRRSLVGKKGARAAMRGGDRVQAEEDDAEPIEVQEELPL